MRFYYLSELDGVQTHDFPKLNFSVWKISRLLLKMVINGLSWSHDHELLLKPPKLSFKDFKSIEVMDLLIKF